MIECQKCYNAAQVMWRNDSLDETLIFCLDHDPLVNRETMAGKGWVRQFHPPQWWDELAAIIERQHAQPAQQQVVQQHETTRGPNLICERPNCNATVVCQIWSPAIKGIAHACGDCGPQFVEAMWLQTHQTVHWCEYVGVGPRPDTAGRWAKKGLGLAAGIAIGAIFGG